jgi:hypothetical protein
MIARDLTPATLEARLADAAERGESLELILVLRGRVRPARGLRRWRIRLQARKSVTISADWVLAATPVPARPARDRSGS